METPDKSVNMMICLSNELPLWILSCFLSGLRDVAYINRHWDLHLLAFTLCFRAVQIRFALLVRLTLVVGAHRLPDLRSQM